MRSRFYLWMWKHADSIAGLFDCIALWAKTQWRASEANPLRGRHVRWIETGGMGQDKRVETGVVTRLYKDTLAGERSPQLFVEVRISSGASHCLPLRCFFENPDDGALEYRY